MDRSDLRLDPRASADTVRGQLFPTVPLGPGAVLLGRYLIQGLLQEGGMSHIYAAWDSNLHKHVAIKALKMAWLSSEEQAIAANQFQQEAHLVASLDHPALPRVTNYFQDGRASFLVMGFIPGESLDRVLGRFGRPLPEGLVVYWGWEMARALEYLHSLPRPIIMRDLKPSNVMVTPDGHLRLIDFGISKACETPSSMTRTAIRGSGTPGYAPPEQYGTQGHRTDARSDLYALGATMYTLLTGQLPPDAMERTLSGIDALHPRAANPDVSEQIDALIGWMTRLRADDRPPSAGTVLQVLARLPSGPPEGPPPLPPGLRIEPAALSPPPSASGLQPPVAQGGDYPASSLPPTQFAIPVGPAPPSQRSRSPWKAIILIVLAAAAVTLWAGARLLGRDSTLTLSPAPSATQQPSLPPTSAPSQAPTTPPGLSPAPQPSLYPTPAPEPALRPASLALQTRPPGARVTILGAGENRGGALRRTPITLSGLRPGTYRVILEKDGYQFRTFAVTLTPGQDVSRELILERTTTPARPATPLPRPASRRLVVERVRFARGAVSATLYRQVAGAPGRAFLLEIGAGQVMTVRVDGPGRVVNVYRKRDMASLQPLEQRGGTWRCRLPETGDYLVQVVGTGGVSVTFYIPPP